MLSKFPRKWEFCVVRFPAQGCLGPHLYGWLSPAWCFPDKGEDPEGSDGGEPALTVVVVSKADGLPSLMQDRQALCHQAKSCHMLVLPPH